jgi:GNAT superfamily N-acetyltransferase
MKLTYKVNDPISVSQFVDLLKASTLAERRPVNDLACMQGMLDHADLIVTAWDEARLVGIARSVTDFHYACYLSDLAVDLGYQRAGIGKTLQAVTQEQLGPHCNLILLAAPAADTYYGHIGFANHPRCWVLARDRRIRS